jgi:hypothetical protein
MQREELVRLIEMPPPLRVGKRLQKLLNSPLIEEKPCANPDCFNFFTPTPKRKLYCSLNCVWTVGRSKGYRKAGQANSEKRRGCNPDRYIQIRVNGARIYLHRYIIMCERCEYLDASDIVHHKDRVKHHNCYGSQLCEECTTRFFCFLAAINSAWLPTELIRGGFSNLEVLTGDAAREHIHIHQQELRRARRVKQKCKARN